MGSNDNFASPISRLAEVGVASVPTGGQGLRLNETGKVPKEALVEPWREIGAPGQPAFEGTWVNLGGATSATAAFYRDASGVVRLKGNVKSGTVPSAAFTLPDGYRPVSDIRFAVMSNSLLGMLFVATTGVVTPAIGSNLSFDLHVSFRAA